jgi:DNA-binding beta-propeller fold protein YncE
MALDTLGMRLLVTERQDRHVKAVDLMSGERTVVSSNTVPDTANPFEAPLGIVVDAAGNRALIASSSLGQGSSVLAMSLATGQRSVVAANNSGLLTGPKALALDAARNRVLVADELWQTLSSADLTSGAIGGLTDLDDPDNPIDLPYALALDPAKQLAYVLEGSFAAVLVVDLVTGRRVFL